jgi:3' terminal RNA ribose 2'-O-methyltransferase Hen1
MLLAISTTHQPATDLGYLLHKHPQRCQSYDLSFGRAHVFYPVADEESCTCCLLLDVDPVGLVRGKGFAEGLFDQYVNDRPYVASSLLSVAIAQVLGSALGGRCKDRPELAVTPIPLSARIDVLPVRAGDSLIRDIFEPLSYNVATIRYPLDTNFTEWGASPYMSLMLAKTTTLAELLTHLYVLIPVFDNHKHYFVGDAEVEKLLAKGKGWLPDHPHKEQIVRRYLKHRADLSRAALARLVSEVEDPNSDPDDHHHDHTEALLEKTLTLHEQRHGAVLAALRACAARSVLDLGCGEGRLLRELTKERSFDRIVGVDVSTVALERARERLELDRLPEPVASRVELLQGSLTYRDDRLAGFDAAAVVEVVEHLDPPRLRAFERVLFEFARPQTVVVTTPNREYNAAWENIGPDKLRHPDHRFEWTRSECAAWANRVADLYGYLVRIQPIGPVESAWGAPTQMAIFTKNEATR